MQAERTSYEAAIARRAGSAGRPGLGPPARCARRAEAVMALETAIARSHATPEASANDHNTDNLWSRADFAREAPGMDWTAFFAAAGLAKQATFVAWQPSAREGRRGAGRARSRCSRGRTTSACASSPATPTCCRAPSAALALARAGPAVRAFRARNARSKRPNPRSPTTSAASTSSATSLPSTRRACRPSSPTSSPRSRSASRPRPGCRPPPARWRSPS